MVLPLGSLPSSRDGFYAVNNQFLANGPKGFAEFKMLENEDMYIRLDLPGVPPEGVRIQLDATRKAVMVFADAPKDHKYDFSNRAYGTNSGLTCDCCEISGFTSHMMDGVLRLVLTKTKTATKTPSCIAFLAGPDYKGGCGSAVHKFPHGSDPHDPALTGRTLLPHPIVNYGSEMAFESKRLPNGGLFVRVDMPGVPKDQFSVSVEKGRVTVFGLAPAISHDSSGRIYLGDVAMFSSSVRLPVRRIKTITKHGIIRLIIPPV
ncbi:hypothetical protein AALP_AA8G260800 [Arabis alpina]|uniref:SHSP domain-containing protein n=1 Tax=Arabis alpina TaxID=50452 RepID=A0A087G9H6_ARAAL|nr:hypothetical protein AALP_AA8G260800 [Arabis alpina]